MSLTHGRHDMSIEAVHWRGRAMQEENRLKRRIVGRRLVDRGRRLIRSFERGDRQLQRVESSISIWLPESQRWICRGIGVQWLLLNLCRRVSQDSVYDSH